MHPKVKSALELCKGPFSIHRHDAQAVEITSPTAFAAALGISLDRICKCLFLRCSDPHQFALALCSCTKMVNVSRVAEHLHCAGVRIAPSRDLDKHVGYPTKGVSPLGINELPLFIDDEVLIHQTIFVGAGVVGVEIELSPTDLV